MDGIQAGKKAAAIAAVNNHVHVRCSTFSFGVRLLRGDCSQNMR